MAGRILIVDDVATNRIVLKARLASAFHDTALAASGAEALDNLRSAPPDLVLLDLDLPDMSGFDVIRRLRADPATCRLPVIIVTARCDAETRLAGLQAGADEVFPKPVEDRLLLARIRSLLRRDDPADRQDLPALVLQEQASPYDWPGLICLTAFPPAEGLSLARRLAPHLTHHRVALRDSRAALLGDAAVPADAYLIDATDPRPAFALLSELRASPDTRHAGIALCVDGPENAALACDLGADDIILPCMSEAESAFRLSALVARNRADATRRASIRDNIRLAMTDPLTGLFNRRYALRRMGEMSRAAVDRGARYAVLLADIDRFKQVNDRYGHAAGDHVLTEVARRLASHLGPDHLIARIGGEEFLIGLPDCTMDTAARLARSLCATVADRPVLLSSGQGVAISISIGLALACPGTLPNDVVERADAALLEAKLQGRNRVIACTTAA